MWSILGLLGAMLGFMCRLIKTSYPTPPLHTKFEEFVDVDDEIEPDMLGNATTDAARAVPIAPVRVTRPIYTNAMRQALQARDQECESGRGLHPRGFNPKRWMWTLEHSREHSI